jgi:hypothetical protein
MKEWLIPFQKVTKKKKYIAKNTSKIIGETK